MAIDLTGIDNRGEFYSHHYLDALLESDLKPLWKRWAQTEKDTPGFRSPDKRLPGLGGAYFDARARAFEPGTTAIERLDAARPFHARWLQALGYERQSSVVALEDGSVLALVHEERRGGRPELWVLETGFPEPGEDPLAQRLLPEQLQDHEANTLSALTVRQLLDRELFRVAEPPTWVLVLSGSEVLLTHRHKWGRGKALAFDLDELFARRQAKSFKALAGLLHADALVPGDGPSLHEHLDQASHKHAFAVSGDLRQGAEQAIELLGNEAAWYLRQVRKQGVFGQGDRGIDAGQLTRDCLVFLYRLIFLFYVEARSEDLGIAPMRADAYRKGYSLESLRELEQVPLTSPQAQQGTYLHDSLKQLFKLMNQGYPTSAQTHLGGTGDGAAFRMRGLHSRLFDDGQLPLLSKVRLRNLTVQRVIALLSLSKEGAHRERGRISYASLGINQLGAVYEGLLSYTGFFAKEDLIEVVNAGERDSADARTFFVPARHRDRYDDAEIVREGKEGPRKTWPRGSFLYRLAGRDREKSASYYTPEVLTQCLVRYTLKERLGTGDDALSADEILNLTVCEPAMGSGAFLNETVDQLAEAYLDRKQAEEKRRVEPDRYQVELARVKAHIAANNCYGVDLNPLACELGKISLWLNVLRPGARAPFFDPRLQAGNSLVGARLATYGLDRLHRASKKAGPNWLKLAPEPLEGPRGSDRVYQFLLPAEGMADFARDKVVKALVPDQVATVKAWQKGLNRAWSAQEQARLLRLSQRVDTLWAEHTHARVAALQACAAPTSVWPQRGKPDVAGLDEDALAKAWARANDDNLAGRRLKQAMDVWCALWFWPLDQAELLPTRVEWLGDLESVLEGRLPAAESVSGRRLAVAAKVAELHRFVHWEWAFPEVFARGGFDVVVGNPPWSRVNWSLDIVLSDFEPRLAIRARLSEKEKRSLREPALAVSSTTICSEYESASGTRAFLNSVHGYPDLAGVKANTYKCFLLLGCRLAQSTHGSVGFFHQPAAYDDPGGGTFRAAIYPRLRLFARFRNELRLFEGIGNATPYCFSVLSRAQEIPNFTAISNLFHPRTIEDCFTSDGLLATPGIRTETNEWNLTGHPARLLHIGENELRVISSVFDRPPNWRHTRLAALHSQESLELLRSFVAVPKLGPPGEGWSTTREWNEGDRKDDGTIDRADFQPDEVTDLILSGPTFFVATPFNKSPNKGCRSHRDYSPIDHQTIDERFLPRSTYRRRCSLAEYAARSPTAAGKRVWDSHRHVHREMVNSGAERTLIPAIAPAGAASIATAFTTVFQSARQMAGFSGLCSSILVDGLVKMLAVGHINVNVTSLLPAPPQAGPAAEAVVARALLLNCLTTHYRTLWSECFHQSWRDDRFTKADDRLPDGKWGSLCSTWEYATPGRSPFVRRQLLVELDALSALVLGVPVDALCLLYATEFPVLRKYERDTWYDQRGRVVFTNRGLPGVGIAKRKDWNAIRDAQTQADLPDADWTSDALGRYQPPFDFCDRETDMRQAYTEFVRRGIEPARHDGDGA